MTDRNAAERIRAVVAAIPPGRVASYGQVAKLAGQPGRARYVGRVLGQTPPERGLPWFRVVAAGGRIAFPHGTEARREQLARLKSEGISTSGGRVDMAAAGWAPDLDKLLWGPPPPTPPPAIHRGNNS